MADLPRMNERQRRRAKRLIRRLCANYDGGNCLPLDDGDVCPCPQLLTPVLICKYFRAAVLPADWELCAEITGETHIRRCCICGAPVLSRSNAAKYGPAPPQIEGLKVLRRNAFRAWKRGRARIYPRRAKTSFNLRKSAPYGMAAASRAGLSV